MMFMTTKALGLALLSVLVALVAMPGISPAAPVKVKATAADEWNPSYLHIAPGVRVVWANPERLSTTHDVTAYGRGWSKSVVLQAGERTGKRFNNTGTYKYRCRLHSQLTQDGQCRGMCGVVHVMR